MLVYLEACRRKHQGVPLRFGVVATTMARKVSVAVGSQVWVEDPADVAWIDGEVLEVKGSEIKISCSTGRMVTAKISDVHPKDPKASPSGVDDMTKLAYLFSSIFIIQESNVFYIGEKEYIACLKSFGYQSEKYRHLSKKYLQCRMERLVCI
ncbi:hypothetical protein ZIOFF_039271 [Zingiber officinale]|uniref:Myosin N-terminal SH3-like domain-containing protein n=1 Tax=Zingiber officinale TaxID=94328 RepID=A0A8J5L018_ZINOF|nr:hypothetical protein ZIOFF_039271 [Zingiber officinale]